VSDKFTIFTGTANPALAAAVARELGVQVGACAVDRFPDGEVAVQLLEAESIRALLGAGASPEIIVAATHGLLLRGARDKLEHPSVREVFVTDTVGVAEKDWPQLRVISIAPLIAGALERFLAGGPIGDLY
jgi:phosphoribosylpyrophosphate synthetase